MNKKTIINFLIGIIIVGITVVFYSNFSLYTDYIFTSNNYIIENNYIYNISIYTSEELYKKYFDIKNYTLKIENESNYISNGSKLILLDKNKKQVSTLTNIVKGDIVSNGIIDTEDINKFNEYLNSKYELKEHEFKCLDINDDNNITETDLILLKDSLESGIENISLKEENITLQIDEQYRLGYTITPNYGINTNLKWTSNNENIVTIDDSGLIIPHKLGETTITVENYNSTIKKEVKVKIDNNIKLSSNSGNLFLNDPELPINIKSGDYKNIECISSNTNIATCRIENDILYIKALNKGESIITVTSPKYGQTNYNLNVYSSYLDFIPEYYCIKNNKKEIINLNYKYNNIKITNNNLITNLYIKENQLYIESGPNTGRDEIIIKGNNESKKMTIDIYNLNIPSIGAFIKVGDTKSANIVSNNTGELKCITPNSNIAECYVENKKLYVKGINSGEVNLTIKNTINYNNKEYECGETNFLAVIKK